MQLGTCVVVGSILARLILYHIAMVCKKIPLHRKNKLGHGATSTSAANGGIEKPIKQCKTNNSVIVRKDRLYMNV